MKKEKNQRVCVHNMHMLLKHSTLWEESRRSYFSEEAVAAER